uniref:Uncharacterized protein n=1 Tax=Arundo donax TaxID=35708 RepID=A0A0A9EI20_ARUDO
MYSVLVLLSLKPFDI